MALISSGELSASPNGQELLAEFMKYGQQRPFEEIVRRYAGMVFNVCLRVTKDKHDAEDATQAVFLTLAVQAKRGAEIKALGPWLQQVAKRLALDLRRSKGRRKNREERHHEEQTQRRNSIVGNSLPEADLDELKTILHEELNKLPTKYRLPLILHYFGGLTRDEMAAELNCKPSTLGVRIFRGREMLAGRLNGRGVTMSSASFAVVLAYTIKSAVSHAMISTTSHAASALAGGHSGIGLVSSQVIGLTRSAGGAMVLGKVKFTTAVLLVACSTLGAGAKAFGMLPQINVQQMIANTMQRLIRPLVEPLKVQLRVDAAPAPKTAPQRSAPAISQSLAPVAMTPAPAPMIPPRAIPAAVATAIPRIERLVRAPAIDPPPVILPARPAPVGESNPAPVLVARASVPSNSNALAVASPTAVVADAATEKPAVPTANDVRVLSASASRSSLGGAGAGGGTGRAISSPSVLPTLSLAPAPAGANPYYSTRAGGGVMLAYSQADVHSILKNHSAAHAPAPVKQGGPRVVELPANDGRVTMTNGVIRGYGNVTRTGTLDVSGQVIADGGGTDHTLDLTRFSAIKNDIDNPRQGGMNGWYAQNHGRLTLALQQSSDGSATFGESASDPVLDLVNSLRLAPADPTAGPLVAQLSLLSIDRSDVPSLAGFIDAPVGLWQVNDGTTELAAADITIRYNDLLVGALGADESTLSLWTYGSGQWQPVDPSLLSINSGDHLISASATDFSYLAIGVQPAPDVDAGAIIATPLSNVAPNVPEPSSLALLAASALWLLGGRRRRVQN